MESSRLRRVCSFISFGLAETVLLSTIPWGVNGAPIAVHTRSLKPIGSVDPGTDAWAEALVGIGPLILLVGERSTKQLLRNVRGVHNAFSLAAAPLGLLSIVTSVLRLCGVQRLRAFIGYELEARVAAAVEMTRVNCGGVHAELVDGYIVRSTSADPSGQAIAVSKLEGDYETLATEAVLQIDACDAYKHKKRDAGVPEDIAPVRWCLQIQASGVTGEAVASMVRTLAEANGVRIMGEAVQSFERRWVGLCHKGKRENDAGRSDSRPNGEGNGEKTRLTPIASGSMVDSESNYPTPQSPKHKRIGEKGRPPLEKFVSSFSTDEQGRVPPPAAARLTYFYTFEAVSEFATSIPVSKLIAVLQGMVSLLFIFALHFLGLRQNEWHIYTGWTLAFAGYLGIVLCVMTGALLIHSSCECIVMDSRSSSSTSKAEWVDGITVSVKNTDSMDTSGSNFWRSPLGRPQVPEAVWRKDLTPGKSRISSAIVVALVVSFICHYLGLRSSRWWIGVGELLICISAAFARSITKDHQEKFNIVEGLKVDKRCSSTGIIRVQKSVRIDRSLRTADSVDIRAYEENPQRWTPMTGERIAWHVAMQCAKDSKVSARILELTGLFLATTKEGQGDRRRAVFVSFLGGILVEEGLAYPDARMGLGFRSRIDELAAPTPLLVRAIMRQPRWIVDHPELKKGTIPTGSVYIFSISSMMTWWTISEDRNDTVDLQNNLQWPLLLVNIAFFIAVLTMPGVDVELVDTIKEMHEVSASESETGEAIVKYFQDAFV